jgi:protein-S-isoprenylcysteine O-methyltransferase Ste14
LGAIGKEESEEKMPCWTFGKRWQVSSNLIITAKKEEIENIQYFGEKYREYMKHTTMFVPFIF